MTFKRADSGATTRVLNRLEAEMRPLPGLLSLVHCRGLQALARMHAIDPRLPGWARARWRWVALRYVTRAKQLEWRAFLASQQGRETPP